MSNDRYNFTFIKKYIDEDNNEETLVYRITDLETGLSCVMEGIHEYKLKRKGIKKLQKLIKEQESSFRNKK